MGRKAKEAAQQKIGEWTGRNVSKTTTKTENTNASSENRAPLQTHSQSDINAMKNCSVRLEKIRSESKTSETVSKTPAKQVPTADVITKDKQADAKNVYDYSFDADDDPGPMKQTEDEMKDLFEKLAKDNIIEVKKYRPKNVKKKKTDEKVPAKKEATQKRRREKQPIDVEPPQKKPNLKGKVAKIDAGKSGTSSVSAAAVPPPPQSPQRNVDAENLANNNIPAKKVTFESKQTENAKVAIRSSPRKQANTVDTENVIAQLRPRNRVLNSFQSTPKSSTPVSTKATAQSKENNRSLNSLFFENASPLLGSTRATRANTQKHRLQLSAIDDSQDTLKSTHDEENDHVPQIDNFDDDFDFGNNMANEPEPNLDVDKENSLDRPSTSAAALSVQNKPSTSSAALNLWDQPSTSAAAFRTLDRPGTSVQIHSNVLIKPGTSSSSSVLRSRGQPSTSSTALNAQDKPRSSSAASSLWDQPSTSAAAFRSLDRSGTSVQIHSNVLIKPGTNSSSSVLRSRDQPSTSSTAQTPRRDDDRSIFDIQDTSEHNIFSPTKRVQRVYGRSPLKNITSEVNNTNSPSFDSMKSLRRSFGVLPKSTPNSIQTTSAKDTSLTLPEASYFSSRRVAQDFDRNVDNHNLDDKCFGFDDGDEEEEIINETTTKASEHAQTIDNDVSKSEGEKLKEIRAKLKRYLHNPDAEPNQSIKMSKVTKTETVKDKNKAKKGKTPKKTPMKTPVKTPIKTPAKTAKSPAKPRPRRNIVFGDTGAKQEDIRNAFTVKSTDKHSKSDKSKDDPTAVLFEEFETVQDRRRSYSRPQRQRKRRISIDSEESEEEQQPSDDEDYDENGKPSKRAKRRKKTAEPNPKELEELDEFAKKLNEHFEEIDSFDVVVE